MDKGTAFIRSASQGLEDLRGFQDLHPDGDLESATIGADGLMMVTYYLRISKRRRQVRGQVVFTDRDHGRDRAVWGICRAADVNPLGCGVFFDFDAEHEIATHGAAYLILEEGPRGLGVTGFCESHVERAFKRDAYRIARQFGRCARRDCVWLPDLKHKALCANHRRSYRSVTDEVRRSVAIYDPDSLFAERERTAAAARAPASQEAPSSLTDLFSGEESTFEARNPNEDDSGIQHAREARPEEVRDSTAPSDRGLPESIPMAPADFRALASSTRAEILNMLSASQLTLTDISNQLLRPKSSTLKHLHTA